MAQLTSTVYSENLNRYVTFLAIIPTQVELMSFSEDPAEERAFPERTLYLLHGWTGNHLDWLSMSRVYELKASMGIHTLADIRPENNPYELVMARTVEQAVYLSCGLEDGLLEENQAFHQYLLKNNIPHKYSETSGDHDWDYWNEQIEQAIEWMIEE